MSAKVRITVWNEFRHEKDAKHKAREIYPEGIHKVLADFLSKQPGFTLRTATLDEPEHGLTQDVLNQTDVLTWWGHCAHREVSDEIVERVHKRVVLDGMGLVVLHSGHFSKIFQKLMGTTCNLTWRGEGERMRVFVVEPGHPIADGLPKDFVIPEEEMYGERFDIPAPDELVFLAWFQGGNVFRSGCCFRRGRGKIFYFSAGHESFPVYYQPEVQRVIENACRWATPGNGPAQTFGCEKPSREPIVKG